MRLRRLDLIRFGQFTDFSLDFGQRDDNTPDLHIIFGPNEAGKTTAFDGYLDLLFGIPSRSKYNFLHDYENMRIGGVLEIDGNAVDLIRIKRSKGDLITPSGDAVSPTLLSHTLDGIDRDQYRAMFSLDDETIEAGGDDILASKGNLGELLFSAAAGLSDLSSVMEMVSAEVEKFHKPRGRRTELAEAKGKLKELQSQIREVDVPASEFRRLKADRDTATELLEKAKGKRDAFLRDRTRLVAMIECLPLLNKLQETDRALQGYSGYPSAPDGAAEEAQHLKSGRIETETKLRQSSLQLEIEEKALNELAHDTAITGIGDELTVLLDIPKSRAQTADEDLPKRDTEMEGVNNELSGFATELGVATPEEGIIPEIRLVKLEEVAGQINDAKKDLAIALREEATALQKSEALNRTEVDRKEIPELTELERLLEDIQPEDRISRQEGAAQDVSAAESALDAALQKLRPWSGESSDLASLSLSKEEAGRLAGRWTDLCGQRDDAARKLVDAQVKAKSMAARLGEFEQHEAASADCRANEARSERDNLWEEHSKALTPETATKFHASMKRDDEVQDARLGFAEGLARLREIQLEAVSSKADVESREEALKSANDVFEENTAQVSELLAGLGLPGSYDPRDLPVWQTHLLVAQERISDLEKKKTIRENTTRSAEDAVTSLRTALAIDGEAPSLRDLVKRARTAVADAAKARAKHEADKQLQNEAKSETIRRADKVKRLSESIGDLQKNWDAEINSLPKSLRSVDDFRWKLSTLRSLGAKFADRHKLQRRIEAMRKDQAEFESGIRELARRAGERVHAAPLVLGERLRRRLEIARKSEADLENLTVKISNVAAGIRTSEAHLKSIDQRVDELAVTFKEVRAIQSIDDLLEILGEATKADQLRKDSLDLQDRILTRLGVTDMAAAEDLLLDQDALELEARKTAVESDLDRAEAEYMEKVGDLRSASDALERVGGDDKPARLLEARQTLLLELKEKARTALRLRLGVLAAEQALVEYREEHRSGMLADTETAFNALTGGRYRQLRTQADGQKELLLALRERDSRSITVAEMSKGTRFQLYLALRLAGYRQYASGGTTLPFVADDIMETFDNTRTTAALNLLREIAGQGQALYFTHHEHVMDLAREVCGDSVRLHRLPVPI